MRRLLRAVRRQGSRSLAVLARLLLHCHLHAHQERTGPTHLHLLLLGDQARFAETQSPFQYHLSAGTKGHLCSQGEFLLYQVHPIPTLVIDLISQMRRHLSTAHPVALVRPRMRHPPVYLVGPDRCPTWVQLQGPEQHLQASSLHQCIIQWLGAGSVAAREHLTRAPRHRS